MATVACRQENLYSAEAHHGDVAILLKSSGNVNQQEQHMV